MTKHLKEVCCCEVCESMNFLQDALNQLRRKKRKELRLKWMQLPEGRTRQVGGAKEAALEIFEEFSSQAFVGDQDLHPTPRDAALSMQQETTSWI